MIRCSDVANVAAFFGVPENTLGRWYYDHLERQQQQPRGDVQPITSLGVDELSLKESTGSPSR